MNSLYKSFMGWVLPSVARTQKTLMYQIVTLKSEAG